MLEQYFAFHAEFAGSSGGLANVIRLHGADRDDRVRPFLERRGHRELELAGLVAAGREPGAIVALDVDLWTTELGAKPRHRLKSGWQVRKRHPWKFVEHRLLRCGQLDGLLRKYVS